MTQRTLATGVWSTQNISLSLFDRKHANLLGSRHSTTSYGKLLRPHHHHSHEMNQAVLVSFIYRTGLLTVTPATSHRSALDSHLVLPLLLQMFSLYRHRNPRAAPPHCFVSFLWVGVAALRSSKDVPESTPTGGRQDVTRDRRFHQFTRCCSSPLFCLFSLGWCSSFSELQGRRREYSNRRKTRCDA